MLVLDHSFEFSVREPFGLAALAWGGPNSSSARWSQTVQLKAEAKGVIVSKNLQQSPEDLPVGTASDKLHLNITLGK